MATQRIEHDSRDDEEDTSLVSGLSIRITEKRPRYTLAICTILLLLAFIVGIVAWETGMQTGFEEEDTLEEDSTFNQDMENDDSMILLGNFSDKDFAIQQLAEAAQYCASNEARIMSSTNDYDRQVFAANCGSGYKYMNSTSRYKPFNIVLLGSKWRDPSVFDLSGCPLGTGKCPLSPLCTISQIDEEDERDADSADLALLFQSQAHLRSRFATYKVLYWREAMFLGPLNLDAFDFEMGVHYFAGLPNPYFVETPRQYAMRVNGVFVPSVPVKNVLPPKLFAMSLISHCNADSLRDEYLLAFSKALQASNEKSGKKRRLDRYGECGNLKLPPKPLGRANEMISNYKFYFAMENEIQNGYVTEKLFYTLSLGGPIPVYFGSPHNVLNITQSHKFVIQVADFPNVQALLTYLLYLDDNEDKRLEYLSWRQGQDYSSEYLDLLSTRIAGPEELMQYEKTRRFPRTAQCCRLCDENFVQFAKQTKTRQKIGKPWTKKEIMTQYFQ